jgi:hypothetical protein
MDWIPAGDDYTVRLRGSGAGADVVCRNAKGRELARVPAKLKGDPAVTALRSLRTRLSEHEEEVLAEVRTWMLRSLPVPVALIAASVVPW